MGKHFCLYQKHFSAISHLLALLQTPANATKTRTYAAATLLKRIRKEHAAAGDVPPTVA